MQPTNAELESFDGKPNEWDSFIFHFHKIAHYHQWSNSEKRYRLLTCLRGKAVTFIRGKSKKTYSTYRRLQDTLDARFGHLELPSTAQRHLAAIKQEEAESLEDFSDRVLIKASEAYPDISDEAIQSIATESFLAGCKDQAAAYAASEKNPDTVYDALCGSLWPTCVFSGDRQFLCAKSLLRIRSQDQIDHRSVSPLGWQKSNKPSSSCCRTRCLRVRCLLLLRRNRRGTTAQHRRPETTAGHHHQVGDATIVANLDILLGTALSLKSASPVLGRDTLQRTVR